MISTFDEINFDDELNLNSEFSPEENIDYVDSADIDNYSERFSIDDEERNDINEDDLTFV